MVPQLAHMSNKIMWSNVVQLKFVEENPTVMFFKYEYESEYQSFTFRVDSACTRKAAKEKSNNQLSNKKYSIPIGISAAKKRDLLTLCAKSYIPKNHHQFFQALPVSSERSDDIPRLVDENETGN